MSSKLAHVPIAFKMKIRVLVKALKRFKKNLDSIRYLPAYSNGENIYLSYDNKIPKNINLGIRWLYNVSIEKYNIGEKINQIRLSETKTNKDGIYTAISNDGVLLIAF